MTATILITGFGPFPGAPFNPTEPLAMELARRRHPAFANVRRVAHVFPVSYAAIDRELPALLEEIGARTLLDAPCGDYNWIKETELGVDEYIGVDIIPELIERNQRLYRDMRTRFSCLDLTRDKLPRVDVILCRDCLIHFSYRHIAAALKNFKRSRSTYLLTNTYPAWRENQNIRTGDFRHINLLLPPFNFPPPLKEIDEKFPEEQAQFFGKVLGLWRLADL